MVDVAGIEPNPYKAEMYRLIAQGLLTLRDASWMSFSDLRDHLRAYYLRLALEGHVTLHPLPNPTGPLAERLRAVLTA